MGCLSLLWLQQLLVWIVVIGAVVAIVQVLVPAMLGQLGVAGGAVVRVLSIVMWSVVLIAVIYIVFDLLICAIGGIPRARLGP